jgi:hypothetical protein
MTPALPLVIFESPSVLLLPEGLVAVALEGSFEKYA